MGSASEELAQVVKLQPVPNVDYYIVCYKAGDLVPRGWLQRRETKSGFTREVVSSLLVAAERRIINPCPDNKPAVNRRYYLYPGQRPDKKWGPVCP